LTDRGVGLYTSRVPIFPPALAPGARVALIAPAGPLRGDADVARAVENARSFGWEPRVGLHVLERDAYFAGRDADRLEDVNLALHDPTIDGIWCLRGGYGAMRLLDRIDWGALRRHPRAILGYSDITALHCAVALRTDLVSFHAPVARGALTPFSRDSLERAVMLCEDSCGTASTARVIRAGRAEGRLAGGNLALLSALAGTPYAPSFDGALVVLEDINEAVYRLDRMLQQLLLAGAFNGCRGIVFGDCTNCPEESDDGARSLDVVLRELADRLDVPCFTGAPVGHIDDQWTLPLGARGSMDADARELHVLYD
jgi:muramoyltetrapeptide carboxypeptidase